MKTYKEGILKFIDTLPRLEIEPNDGNISWILYEEEGDLIKAQGNGSESLAEVLAQET